MAWSLLAARWAAAGLPRARGVAVGCAGVLLAAFLVPFLDLGAAETYPAR